MNDCGASPSGGPGPDLSSVFAGLRDELISTLWFVLGNREDALDAAQEAFLKCWRARESLDGVHNLRAWIFRVGVNAAKDMKRSAWRRRARPLTGEIEESAMYAEAAAVPADTVDR